MKGLLIPSLRANMRSHLAAIIAITISVAFIAAALTLSATLTANAKEKIENSYAKADGIVQVADQNHEDSQKFAQILAKVEKTPGVGAVLADRYGFGEIGTEATNLEYRAGFYLIPTPPFARDYQVVSGTIESTSDKAAVSQAVAKELKLKVGSSFYLQMLTATKEKADEKILVQVGAIVEGLPLENAVALPVSVMKNLPQSTQVKQILVKSDGQPWNKVQQALQKNIDDTSIEVIGRHAAVVKDLDKMGFNSGIMLAFLLLFPTIAAVVSVIVVATTFSISLTRRRREFALLRCVGLTRAAIARLLIVEAAMIGMIGAIVGTLMGAGLVIGLTYLSGAELGSTIFTLISPTRLIITVMVGVGLALIAGAGPALVTTKIPPVAAMAQVQDISAGKSRRTKRVLVTATFLITVLGALLVATGLKKENFALSLGGSVLLYLGLLIGAAIIIPKIIYTLAAVGKNLSVTLNLARENALLRAGRTAGTTIAIAIGISLVVTMVVGVSSLRATTDAELDTRRPIDLIFTTKNQSPLTSAQINNINKIGGLAKTQQVSGVKTTVKLGEEKIPMTILEPVHYQTIARANQKEIPAGVLGINSSSAKDITEIEVINEGKITKIPLVKRRYIPDGQLEASAQVWELFKNSKNKSPRYVYAKLKTEVDKNGLQKIEKTIREQDPSIAFFGGAQERLQFAAQLAQILAIVLALLGVAILVSIVGIANSLALSVSERIRENALLRAMGLTKSQIRRMVVFESILIALAAALVGTILGITFGAIGIYALPLNGGSGNEALPRVLQVPWSQILLTGLGATLTAVVAAWLPARRAGKTVIAQVLGQVD